MTGDVNIDFSQRKRPKPLVSEILRPQALATSLCRRQRFSAFSE